MSDKTRKYKKMKINTLLPEASKYFKDFLSLFYHEIDKLQLENNNTLDLFLLRIQNNDFAYCDLVEQLRDVLIPFVLSRNSRAKLEGSIGRISKRAREKFRDYPSKSRIVETFSIVNSP